LDKDDVFAEVKELLISEFQFEAGLISPEKKLDDDLNLDSLDMVDLILRLKDQTGKDIKPSLFKDARTVQDVVDLIIPLRN